MTTRVIFRGKGQGMRNLVSALREQNVKVIVNPKVHGKFRPRESDFNINWGSSQPLNKIEQYEAFQEAEVNVAPFTTDVETAKQWVRDGSKVLCRTLLNGSGGKGITVAKTVEEVIPNARVYCKYVKKAAEFRVHILSDPVTFISVSQKKMMARDRRPDNFVQEVRNHDNGWVFVHEFEFDAEFRNRLSNFAFDCVTAYINASEIPMSTVFAVDVGYNQANNEFNVYEVNTQPGITGITVQDYVNAIKSIIE